VLVVTYGKIFCVAGIKSTIVTFQHIKPEPLLYFHSIQVLFEQVIGKDG